MIWLLLSSLGYLAAAGAAVGAVSYVAATRFSLVQRLLATLTERTLDKIVDREQASFAVTHTDTGILALDITVGRDVLRQTEFSGNRASSIAVQRMEVEFPSLSRPLTLRLHGVRLALQQVRLPRPVSAQQRAAQEAEMRRADEAARLAVVEELLWGSPRGRQQQPSRWNPAGGVLSRLQARVLQRTLAVAVQFVRVEVADVEVKYCQYGEPGPRPAASYLQGADAACLQIRSMTLLPQGSTTFKQWTNSSSGQPGAAPVDGASASAAGSATYAAPAAAAAAPQPKSKSATGANTPVPKLPGDADSNATPPPAEKTQQSSPQPGNTSGASGPKSGVSGIKIKLSKQQNQAPSPLQAPQEEVDWRGSSPAFAFAS